MASNLYYKDVDERRETDMENVLNLQKRQSLKSAGIIISWKCTITA